MDTYTLFAEWLKTFLASNQIDFTEVRKARIAPSHLFNVRLATEAASFKMADEKLCEQIGEKVKAHFTAEDYPLVKCYFEYESPHQKNDPINNIYQIYLHPEQGKMQFRGKLKPSKVKKKPFSLVGSLALKNLDAWMDRIKDGVAPIDLDLYESAKKNPTPTKEELKNMLRIYRNLIDLWKDKELPFNQRRDIRDLPRILASYLDGDRSKYKVVKDDFVINIEDYVLHLMAHPDEDNNFLLALNMWEEKRK